MFHRGNAFFLADWGGSLTLCVRKASETAFSEVKQHQAWQDRTAVIGVSQGIHAFEARAK